MYAICKREFLSQFKSVKSIIFILIITGMTIMIGNLMSSMPPEMAQEVGLNNGYVSGLVLFLFFFGPLLVTSLSHDIVNRETQSRTLRFLVTKTKRDKIILGKFFGVLSFWTACLLIALLIITVFTQSFEIMPFVENLVFLSYCIALSVFLSTIINRPAFSMLIGILLSIAIPVIGVWSMISKSNIIVNVLSVFTPYYYLNFSEQPIIGYATLILTLLLLASSLLIFRKRDF